MGQKQTQIRTSSSSTSSKPGEFDLIERFFKQRSVDQPNSAIALGIGDDCALINPNNDQQMAISTDMLVEGRHFLVGADPYLLGRKCLAVNLSDLAAMGASPVGFTLAIAMPEVKVDWLESFSNGLWDIANEHDCQLIGGDTTAGPLTISITIFGHVSKDQSLGRHQTQVGDDIWVSHQVGDARLSLGALRQEWALSAEEFSAVSQRMHNPTPRTELGKHLVGMAHAAIDISDGLLGDLSHILHQSSVSADILIDQVPGSKTLNSKSIELQRLCKLTGGDDYELCFTAPKEKSSQLEALSSRLGLALTKIGSITEQDKRLIRLIDGHGQELSNSLSEQYLKSFDHFK
jgi:thiamine-monophosphate kinase